MEAVCQLCNKEFEARPANVRNGKAKHCSRECANKSRNNKVEVICILCGAIFWVKRHRIGKGVKYCSRECYRAAGNEKAKTGETIKCLICGKDFYVQPHRIIKGHGLYCSADCRKIGVGSKLKGRVIKGGTYKGSDGYVYVRKEGHPRAPNNYIKRAVLVLEEKMGRALGKGEIAHHINCVKDDDRPENLMEVSRRQHNIIHGEIKRLEHVPTI